jgi:hypothetical protein
MVWIAWFHFGKLVLFMGEFNVVDTFNSSIGQLTNLEMCLSRQ